MKYEFNKIQHMQKYMFAPAIIVQGLQCTVLHPRNYSIIGEYGIHPKRTPLIKTTFRDLSKRWRTYFITTRALDIIFLRFI